MADHADTWKDHNRNSVDDPVNQHGVNDPVAGVDVKHRFSDNKTPHEQAQTAADVRAEPSADRTEPFLPEALRRPPAPPLNKRTGRNPTK